MPDIYDFLAEHAIAYEKHEHPPLYTVEEAKKWTPDLPGAATKNLFLRDKKGKRHVLVVVAHEKQVALKALSSLLGTSPLSFGSPERLKTHLKIEPGSVSVLAVLNDPEKNVELVIDQEIWEANALQCHPLINTQTLIISHEGLETFLKACGRQFRVLEVPAIEG